MPKRCGPRRIFPSINIERSGTRREDLLLDGPTLQRVWTVRRMIDAIGGGSEAAEAVISRMSRTQTNREFLETLSKGDF